MHEHNAKPGMAELAEVMKELPVTDAMQVYGFALGLKAKQETKQQAE